jgi:hypothetical protein
MVRAPGEVLESTVQLEAMACTHHPHHLQGLHMRMHARRCRFPGYQLCNLGCMGCHLLHFSFKEQDVNKTSIYVYREPTFKIHNV